MNDRFWSKVENSSGADCWQWLASTRSGYGYFWAGRHKSAYAHRVAWELCRGPIPEGMCVLHRCDNPGCVNPDHLFLGTKDDNNKDRDAKGRNAEGEENGQAKLTWEGVNWIRIGAVLGATQQFLAECYGVARTTVEDILYNETWRP